MTSILPNFARLLPALALTSLAIIMKADTATDKTLFDFQAATNLPAWEVVNDDVMGGVSTSQFQVLTNRCAVFSGTVRLPRLNPAKVNSVGFLISDKQSGPFRLEIGWIKASPAPAVTSFPR